MSKFLLIPLVIALIVTGMLFWQRTAPLPPAPANSPIIRLAIPELSIDIPVVPTHLNGTKWEYTAKGVAYLASTPLPGQFGNSVFYGHNWPNLLARLPQAKPGQQIITTFADGTHRTFLINTTAVVTPDHIEILNPTTDIRLTLFTCTGFLDRERFVVTAIPM